MFTRHLLLVLTSAVSWQAASAQQELLHYPFNDKDLQSTTTSDKGPNKHTLSMYSVDGEPSASQTGPGVSGRQEDHSFNNSSATGMGLDGQGGWGEVAIPADATIWEKGFASFTVTGWFQATQTKPTGTARIVYVQPSLGGTAMAIWATGGGRLELRLGKAEDGGQSEPVFGGETGEWNYFAVTFDGTKSSNNVRYYAGSESSDVREVGTGSASVDKWLPAKDGSRAPIFIVANGGKDIQRPFQGFIDELRLFGAESGPGGALSLERLEEIRREALSP